MATKITRNGKSAVKRKNTRTTTPRRKTNSYKRENSGQPFQIFFAIAFFALVIVGVAFVLFWSYQKVTASSFFDLRSDKVDVRGINRASADEIKRLVQNETTKTGVWNADIKEIRNEVEKLAWVKSAVVSRVLPDGVRVRVFERIPRAVVRDEKGYQFWVDEDAKILAEVGKDESRLPFILKGWEFKKDDADALKRNQERVRVYSKMYEEWQNLSIVKKVHTVNLEDVNDTQVLLDAGGTLIPVYLGEKDFGNRLKTAIQVIEEKKGTTQVASLRWQGQNFAANAK